MKLHKALLLVALLAVQTAGAATITVTSTADSGPGSLRDALANAADGDTINFAVTGGISLSSGELSVTNAVTIVGPSAGSLAVYGGFSSRVFHIRSNAVVTIANLTITRGRAVQGNGGGIWNNHATLTVSNCTVSWNDAPVGGGGIWNESSHLRVINTTLSGNTAGNVGGGILSYNGTVTIANSTLSGNGTFNEGGAIKNAGGNMRIVNSTLSHNSGPYVAAIANYGYLEIGSTILAEGTGINIYPTWSLTSLGYNLSSDGGGGVLTATGDQINTDPWLGPLQDNGGPTFTHALLGCSPAIDHGKNFSGLAVDQRGDGFVRTFDDPSEPDQTGGDGTDIGAFEAQTHVPPKISCPDDIVANAASPAGALVDFAPTASDNCPVASVTCTPPSGSTFAIGTTTVTCEASYSLGLTSSCAFTIYVKGAAEQINDLMFTVQYMPIDTGVKNGLLVKLRDALNAVNANNKPKACGKLQDFINEVNGQAAKRKIDEYSANYLIGEATRIRAVIGC